MKIFLDPTFQAFTNESRVKKSTSTADSFVGRTLATEDTIKGWQSFWKPADVENPFGEVLSVLSIGSGVNGHIDTAHGGFVSLLLDEALGLAAGNYGPLADKTTMTAYLKACEIPLFVFCEPWYHCGWL